MKIFISQPMKGRSDQEIIKERQELEEFAKQVFPDSKEKIEVINSFYQQAPVTKNPLWYLGKSLEYLSEADAVFFAPSWGNTRGCKIELMSCLLYNIPVYEVEEKEGKLCLK